MSNKEEFVNRCCNRCKKCDPNPEKLPQCQIKKNLQDSDDFLNEQPFPLSCPKWDEWDWGKLGDPNDIKNPNYIDTNKDQLKLF